MRRILKFIFVYALWTTGLLWWARRRATSFGSVAVLTLHRVVPDADFHTISSLPGIVVKASTFAGLAAHISRECEAVNLSRLDSTPPYFRSGKPRVALTFDDGWSDNGAVAAAILSRHSLSALVFICPGLMGLPFPFWPERVIAARRLDSRATRIELENLIEDLKFRAPAEREAFIATLPVPSGPELFEREPLNATLRWDELPGLVEQGMLFGSHTYSHQILTQIPLLEVTGELKESREAIEARLGVPCKTLAYPNGNSSAAIRDAARAAGYKLAFTTRLGLWTQDSDPLSIPRVNISEEHISGLLGGFSQAMLDYNVFWRALWQTKSLLQ
jgi:peptidoglycan/xylan/chitin deacetylase (PgdA/CDA1 family)